MCQRCTPRLQHQTFNTQLWQDPVCQFCPSPLQCQTTTSCNTPHKDPKPVDNLGDGIAPSDVSTPPPLHRKALDNHCAVCKHRRCRACLLTHDMPRAPSCLSTCAVAFASPRLQALVNVLALLLPHAVDGAPASAMIFECCWTQPPVQSFALLPTAGARKKIAN
jgi:hypothetical protein